MYCRMNTTRPSKLPRYRTGIFSPLRFRTRLLVVLGFLSALVYFTYPGASSSQLSIPPPLVLEKPLGTKQVAELPQQQREELVEKNDLSYAARMLTTQIEKIQSSNCSEGYSICCGHNDDYCGLGCQLHHRAACLMMSYTMGIPLIHDSETAWPFDSPWESVYQHLGSNCTPNERTIFVEWDYTHRTPIMVFENETEVKYVLQHGIPIDAELHWILEQNHPNPFLWFVGQFLKYTTRLSNELRPSFENWLEWLQLPNVGPFIGFHVRRTDKVKEANDSFHNIGDYIKPAEEHLRKTKQNAIIPHTVYIASDDHTVLEEAQKKCSTREWRFVGQKMNVTFKNPKERRSPVALFSTVQDIAALSICEYLVCGLSSNLCRVVFEVLNANYPDASERLKSLDEQYRYLLLSHTIPEKLIPVNGPQGVQTITAKKNGENFES